MMKIKAKSNPSALRRVQSTVPRYLDISIQIMSASMAARNATEVWVKPRAWDRDSNGLDRKYVRAWRGSCLSRLLLYYYY